MQHASSLRSVPPRKTPRKGQRQVIDEALKRRSGLLRAQLPTGYGKTLTAAAVFVGLREAGAVNRLLYLVPTTAQLRQFTNDGGDDFHDAGLAGVAPFDISYSPAQALHRHRNNQTVAFASTIQAFASGQAGIVIKEMMQTGLWMVVVDEYHHYGIEKAWGRAALDLSAVFTLAMSATPTRKDQDSAFGEPDIQITYRQALEEGAVKRMELHSYEYKIDAININGQPVSFTTSELIRQAGGDDPQAIDKFMVSSKMRWSPKYISPLVSIPIERLLSRRRNLPLQMIVGAMGCHHAKMVCEQIRSMFGDLLRIDWVGTGPWGRTDAENEEIISKFCPPKINGRRDPGSIELDVLVHVGMAGEGLDSVFVSEVVHLNPASITNQNDQENGRGSRVIPGAPSIVCVINVDSSSPYSDWSGERVMDVFERKNGEAPPEPEGCEPTPRELDEIPDEPLVIIADCELQHIDKGDPEVRGCAIALGQAAGLTIGDICSQLDDKESPIWDKAIELRRRELAERARGAESMSILCQLRKSVTSATGSVASRAARTTAANGMRGENSLIGDMMKRLYTQMSKTFHAGINMADEAGLRDRYKWIKEVEQTIMRQGLPSWLR